MCRVILHARFARHGLDYWGEIPMSVTPQERQCSTKDCEALAEFACMRCGKPLCQSHAYLIRLERRLDTSKHTRDLPALARLPSQIKTYAFCLRCR
jgi:hypothetical protein